MKLSEVKKVQELAGKAIPAPWKLEDDNEGMEPQFGQMWVIRNNGYYSGREVW